jgi:hypothetical protein
MKNKKSKLVVTIASSALLASGAAGADKPPSNQPKNSDPPALSSTQPATMDKAEVKKLLAKVEKEKAPDRQMGAMCYKMATPPERMEYICPVCGERTLYEKEVSSKWTYNLEKCRRLFKEVPKNESMTLDETSFCKKCQPQATNPELKLIVRFRDGTTHTTVGVDSEDMLLLKAFLAGDLSYSTWNDGKTPLKGSLPRLRELLGIQ